MPRSVRGLESRLRWAERTAAESVSAGTAYRLEAIFRRMSDAELASWTWGAARWRLTEDPNERRAGKRVFLERPEDAAEILGEPAVRGLERWAELGGPEIARPLARMIGPMPESLGEVWEAAGRRAREPLKALDASLVPSDRVLPRLGLA